MRAFASPLVAFVALYGALFTAFGVLSPFLPDLLSLRGLTPEKLGAALAAGTAVRLIAGPAGGRVADLLRLPRAVLGGLALLAALAGLAYLPLYDPWLLLLATLLQACALAPIVPVADALSLAAAWPTGSLARFFEYGWVRGAGSAAFVIGVVIGGRVVEDVGFSGVLALNTGLLVAAAGFVACIPNRIPYPDIRRKDAGAGGISTLLRMPTFRRLLVVAALVQGSHAMHDAFAVIRWRDAGIDPFAIGLLWSEGVIGEIVVFLFAGRRILNRIGPARSAVLAALAGTVRWAVLARATDIAAIASVEPLHGLTFALLHLACMDLIRASVPASLAATAQTVYATLGIGLITALLTLAAGLLYGHLGADGFWAMSGLCVLAIPPARVLTAARA